MNQEQIQQVFLIVVSIQLMVHTSMHYIHKKMICRLSNTVGKLMSRPQICQCKFNIHCDRMRQNLQCSIREDGIYKGVGNCDFYNFMKQKKS